MPACQWTECSDGQGGLWGVTFQEVVPRSSLGGYMRFRNGEGGTCTVGSFEPSDAGLFDMVGNLWEWTAGCWDERCVRKVTRAPTG